MPLRAPQWYGLMELQVKVQLNIDTFLIVSKPINSEILFMRPVPGPLNGIRVLDCATFLAAPLAASTLSEFGAEVIKVEQPGSGDSLRAFGTPTKTGDSLVWLSEARNKSSITLNLRDPEGAQLFRQLVAESDVICENFRPGTMEKWGLGYDALKAVNPKIIVLQVSGYGQTGPYKDRPGFARIAHAFGGLSHLAGMPGEAPVTPGSTSLADYMSGVYGAFAIMVALRHRDQTGEGQSIDIALYEPIFRALDDLAPAYLLNGTIREAQGVMTTVACPHGHFKARDGRWIAIACTNDKMFARLARAMGKADLSSADQFGRTQQRLAQSDYIEGLVSAWVGRLDRDDALAQLQAGEVPSSPINSIADIVEDPHIKKRESLTTLTDDVLGDITIPGVVPKLSASPGKVMSLGPRLGESNSRILGDILGLNEQEIAALREKGVI
jgi:crotonobetainyl-CoA:carnitine CoA-transferase CaiB-like acyl-CoA transferase